MSWQTSFDGQFGAYDSQTLSLGVKGTVNTLPVPRGNCNRNAELIRVQAHPGNTGTVWVGQGTLTNDGMNGGFPLAAGGYEVLPDNKYSVWKLMGDQDNLRVMVTYVAGPK